MKFTVVWNPTALDDLAAIWLAASSEDRQGISSDSQIAEAMLKRDAGDIGESRVGEDRVFFAGSLAITIEVREDDRLATILAVHHISRHQ